MADPPLWLTIPFAATVIAAAASDVRSRRIPNVLTVGGFCIALALRSFLGAGAVGAGLLGALLGLCIGLLMLALGGFGGGDVKLLAAVGAFTGPQGFLIAFALTAVIGGVMALAEAAVRGGLRSLFRDVGNLAANLFTFGKRGERQTLDTQRAAKLPYGVAIALGSLAGWFLV